MLAGERFEARGHVYDIADHRVFEVERGPHVAGDHSAAVQADSHAHLRTGFCQLLDATDDGLCGAGRGQSVVGKRFGSAEDGQESVAGELVDGAAFGEHCRYLNIVQLVEERHHLAGRAPLGQTGEAAQIR